MRPTVATTVVQEVPTDYSGLWRVFGWIVGLGFFVLCIWGLVAWLRRRTEKFEAALTEQQRATQARNKVVAAINSLRDKLRIDDAVGKSVTRRKAILDEVSEEFARLGNSEAMNLNQAGLTADQYATIGEQYADLYGKLEDASEELPAHTTVKTSWEHTTKKTHGKSVGAATPEEPAAPGTVVVPVVAPLPIVEDEPVVEHHRHSDDDDETHSSGGGSSTISSDDDDDSRSGRSSGFGGGDSDGGGSSDWGGGGDSGGGGGSSDF